MSANIDQDFVEYVVKSLVGKPDSVEVTRTIDEKGVLLELSVDPEDLGRVIGKRGGTAQSIRTLLRALGTKNDARYNLKIVDTDGGNGGFKKRQDDDNADDSQQNDSYSNDTTQDDSGDDNAVEESTDEVVENETSEYEEKHRKDLADLDDLDI